MGLKQLLAFMKGGKGQNLIIALGLIGIFLIMLTTFWPKSEEKPANTPSSVSAEEYVQRLEQRLEEAIGKIEGVGACKVMVTLENGVEHVYASQQKIDSNRVEDNGTNSTKLSQRDNTEESIVVVDTGDGRNGLLITEIQPTIKGVVVVCSGGHDPQVQERVIKAVTTVLNITSKRVCVVPGE